MSQAYAELGGGKAVSPGAVRRKHSWVCLAADRQIALHRCKFCRLVRRRFRPLEGAWRRDEFVKPGGEVLTGRVPICPGKPLRA